LEKANFTRNCSDSEQNSDSEIELLIWGRERSTREMGEMEFDMIARQRDREKEEMVSVIKRKRISF
jgi:hypothetical protein